MTYELALADRGYSSWSLRGWLMFEKFDIPVKTRFARLYTEDFAALLRDFAPAKTVPAMRTPEGTVICESLAIAEELASRHPDSGLWPANPEHRARARSLMAEIHAGFTALRGACPMNLRTPYRNVPVSPEVEADLRRLEVIWAHARAETGAKGPWLCGDYSLADVFFAPVATRIATYDLKVNAEAQAYVAAHLADPAFRRWRAMGLVDGPDQPAYARDYARGEWPGPTPLSASAVDDGPSVNESCPYSGKPVTHFMELGDKIYGFCNAFCRDKTVVDPEAWPKFMAIYQS